MTNILPVDILLVEDDPADVELTRDTLSESKILSNLHVVENGMEAMEFVQRRGRYSDSPVPDLILLDLNMPVMDGRQFLERLKEQPEFRSIPVIVLTTSSAEEDIVESYSRGANCFVTKPVGLDQFIKVVESIENFWFTVVKLPTRSGNRQGREHI
jgi:two-component system response regulator